MTANALDGEIRDGRHHLTVRVYYEDTDFSGLFEETAKEAPGFAFVVRSMQIEFVKSARMDDLLDIVTATQEVKGASVTLHQRVMRGDEPLIEAHVQVAFVSGGRARRIPEALRIAMRADQAGGSA
jgi:acyl-CoA thioester hydrolase